MKAVAKPKPSEDDRKRSTTLSLPTSIWNRLKAIEEKTGARPSVTATRLLQASLPEEEDASTN